MRFVESVWQKVKPRRKYDNNKFVENLLSIINESHNYIDVKFYKDSIELVYWVKDPYKYTKTLILFYSDYHMEDIDVYEDLINLRDYIYTHMELSDHHIIGKIPHSIDKFYKEGIPVIQPKK